LSPLPVFAHLSVVGFFGDQLELFHSFFRRVVSL
jgi:hypothetical protein